jgi:S-sulfo-L-cysteine synthase (O-acetyl-L-serine-dependent)
VTEPARDGNDAPLERSGVAALIGNTPLVEITRLNPERARGVRVYAKLEGFNPGGSVKDRPALFMIEDGERRGAVTGDRPLIDATSGNTGIAYAMLCAAKGYACELVMPGNASVERQRILQAFGATVTLTDAAEGQDGAIDHVRARVKDEPNRYFYPDQYGNPENPRAHYATTGPEIWRQTAGAVTHFVAGLGTTGTLMGTARFLREKRGDVRVIGLEPSGPFHGLEGLKHLETQHVPEIFNAASCDERVGVDTERAYALTRDLALKEGLFVGGSSGAALAGALDVAASAPAGSVIVTVFPDAGDKYLSTPLWRA